MMFLLLWEQRNEGEAILEEVCVELTKFRRLSGFWAKENGSKETEQTPVMPRISTIGVSSIFPTVR